MIFRTYDLPLTFRTYETISIDMTNTTSRPETKADQLRAALKAAGYKRSQVSVKYPHSTLYVTIRDLSIPKSAIESIANTFSNVRYCEASGEILLGGNTFVDVSYDRAAIRPLVEQVAAILRSFGEHHMGQLCSTRGVDLVVRKREDGWWTVESFTELRSGRSLFVRCDACAGVPDVEMFRHAAQQLVENAIEINAGAPVTDPEQVVQLAADLAAPATVDLEDWAVGL